MAEFKSVHDGHHHVADDDVGHLLPGLLQSVFAVVGFEHDISVFKDFSQIGQDVGIVIDDEDGGSLGVLVGIGRRFSSGQLSIGHCVVGGLWSLVGFSLQDFVDK